MSALVAYQALQLRRQWRLHSLLLRPHLLLPRPHLRFPCLG